MLIPIKYHKRNYPPHIKAKIDEIAGHFDISRIAPSRTFCLHTEYSYGKRKLNSQLVKKFPAIAAAHKKFVPQLWRNKLWSIEFADFIRELCGNNQPKIIEIHPPFSDYINTVDEFLDIYEAFERKILQYFPNTEIVIENRSGSIYAGGKFLISDIDGLNSLLEGIIQKGLRLKIALDIPQLITSYGGPNRVTSSELYTLLNRVNKIKQLVKSIHLWGKRKSVSGRTIAHVGNLDTYFENDEKKQIFLDWFSSFVGDGKIRYFVPEVNSSDKDLWSIIEDLENSGVKFG